MSVDKRDNLRRFEGPDHGVQRSHGSDSQIEQGNCWRVKMLPKITVVAMWPPIG